MASWLRTSRRRLSFRPEHNRSSNRSNGYHSANRVQDHRCWTDDRVPILVLAIRSTEVVARHSDTCRIQTHHLSRHAHDRLPRALNRYSACVSTRNVVAWAIRKPTARNGCSIFRTMSSRITTSSVSHLRRHLSRRERHLPCWVKTHRSYLRDSSSIQPSASRTRFGTRATSVQERDNPNPPSKVWSDVAK